MPIDPVMPQGTANPLAAALARIAHWQHLARGAGIALREPPPQPASCCGRGCNGCVWEGYYAALGWWREDARALLADAPKAL